MKILPMPEVRVDMRDADIAVARLRVNEFLRNPRYWNGLGRVAGLYYIELRDTLDAIDRCRRDSGRQLALPVSP
jgi:hypothetical protein